MGWKEGLKSDLRATNLALSFCSGSKQQWSKQLFGGMVNLNLVNESSWSNKKLHFAMSFLCYFGFLNEAKIYHFAKKRGMQCSIALTHISLVSFVWNIGKQYSPTSGAVLFGSAEFHLRKMDLKFKVTPNAPKNNRGIPNLIIMGKCIRQKWVNCIVVVNQYFLFYHQENMSVKCVPPNPTFI